MIFLQFPIFIYSVFSFFQSVECADPTDISRLRATILQNYDNYTRPVQSHSTVTEVTVSFELMGLNFDDSRGVLTLYLCSYMHWNDEHCVWSPMNYGNLTETVFEATELWRPDISVTNNYDEGDIHHYTDVTGVYVYSTGDVWWIPYTKFQVGCRTDLRLWPYDSQTCSVFLESWTYYGGEINLVVNDNHTELYIEEDWYPYSENREWKLVSSSVKLENSTYTYCCPEIPFKYVRITVELERKSSAHTAAVAIVGSGIAITILMSFWLDPFANERIPITLIAMLINSLYVQYIHRIIPYNGDTVPLVVTFFRDSLIMVTFAFGWVVLMRYMAKTKRNSPVPLPDFVETLLNSFIGTILCLNPRPKSKGQGKAAENTEEGDISELVEEENNPFQKDWEWLARLLDRIIFFFYLFVYIVFISAFL